MLRVLCYVLQHKAHTDIEKVRLSFSFLFSPYQECSSELSCPFPNGHALVPVLSSLAQHLPTPVGNSPGDLAVLAFLPVVYQFSPQVLLRLLSVVVAFAAIVWSDPPAPCVEPEKYEESIGQGFFALEISWWNVARFETGLVTNLLLHRVLASQEFSQII